jgi:peptidoglycan hydrolase CwlO-like protein
MSAISDFAATVNQQFTDIGTSVDGLTADVAQLKAKIDELQNNPGPISPADQALLDDIQNKANAVSQKLKALDDATAPDEVPTPNP